MGTIYKISSRIILDSGVAYHDSLIYRRDDGSTRILRAGPSDYYNPLNPGTYMSPEFGPFDAFGRIRVVEAEFSKHENALDGSDEEFAGRDWDDDSVDPVSQQWDPALQFRAIPGTVS